MLVDLDWLSTVEQRLQEINACELGDITWVKNGKVVSFSEEGIIQFQYMGMNNKDLPKYFEPEEKGWNI